MKHAPFDSQRATKMRRGEKVIYYLGEEAQALADSLGQLPTHIALIEALDDESKRREAMVVVRETLASMRSFERHLQRAIAKLTELHDSLDKSEPSPHSARVTR